MAKQIAYNMDCMEAMREMPDKEYELAIVDPPYGIGADSFNNGAGSADHPQGSTTKRLRLNSGSGKLKDRALQNMNCSWDVERPPQEYFDELFRISKNQ